MIDGMFNERVVVIFILQVYWPIMSCIQQSLVDGGESYIPEDYVPKCVLESPTIKLTDVDHCKNVS